MTMVSLMTKTLRRRSIFLFIWLLIDTSNSMQKCVDALQFGPTFGVISRIPPLATTILSVTASGGNHHNHKHSFVHSSLQSSAQDLSSSTKEEETKPLKLGFIGCGTIASAIATGLLTQTEKSISHVYVSKRSESKSSILAKNYPDRVTVVESERNQDIIDSSDIIFICVLPTQTDSVLESLNFPKEKVLVSLVVSALSNSFRMHNNIVNREIDLNNVQYHI